MKAYAPALRMIWAVAGVMAGAVLILGTASDVLIFALAYGSHPGSYPGQAHDRQLALQSLIWLAAAWAFVLTAMIWPAVRWKRRGMYSAAGEPAGPDQAGEPAR